jgi:hypothetical protein
MPRIPVPLIPCSGCNLKFKASPRQREAHAAGRRVYHTRECQKGDGFVTVTCANPDCRKDVRRRRCDLAESGRAFCDGDCRYKASKPRKGRYITCAICPTQIWVIPSLEGKKTTCSTPCRKEWARRSKVTRKCDYCGTSYTRSPSTVGRFCKKQCSDDYNTQEGQGYVNDDGYVVKSFKGKPRLLHRINAEIALGRPLRSDEDVHHVDTNRLNNETDGPFVLNHRGNLVSGNLEIWKWSQPRGGEIGPQLSWAIDTLTAYEDVLPTDALDQLTHLVGRLAGQEKPQ